MARRHDIDANQLFTSRIFQTRGLCRPTALTLETPARQRDYQSCWAGLTKAYDPRPHGLRARRGTAARPAPPPMSAGLTPSQGRAL